MVEMGATDPAEGGNGGRLGRWADCGVPDMIDQWKDVIVEWGQRNDVLREYGAWGKILPKILPSGVILMWREHEILPNLKGSEKFCLTWNVWKRPASPETFGKILPNMKGL